MGDRIAITTWPKHQNLFYLVNSSGVTFDVKANGNAVVGLAKKPGSRVDYWVGIGDNHRCWIKKDDQPCMSVVVNNILSSEHYSRFWLQWNAGTIRLGRHGEQKPIVSCSNKLPELKYITFSVLNAYNPVHWRFDLPPVKPVLQNSQLNKRISDGKLTWVEAVNQLPDEALIGGYENEVLYIIRASHSGSVTPGKFMPSEGVGYISWGGESHGKSEFEVLCGFDCAWMPTCKDRIPVGAVVGGFSEDRLERLYVGRAVHNGHTIPGKVQPSHKVCYISFEGREVPKKKYEILVEPIEVRCANDTYLSETHNDSSASESDSTWHPDDDDHDDYNIYGYDSNDELQEVMAL